MVCFNSFSEFLDSKNLSSPAYGNTVVTAVSLAIGGNRFKIAYFSYSVGTAHGAPPYCTVRNWNLPQQDQQGGGSLLRPVAEEHFKKPEWVSCRQSA